MSAKGSELKRVRQSKKANNKNRSYKANINTEIKKVIKSTKKSDALSNLNNAIKVIDKVASKGIIHKNKAANKKSKLYKFANSLK